MAAAEHVDQHDRGTVSGRLPAKSCSTVKPLSRIKFGYVFQNYREAMFPWLRAFDNIAYPLR